MKKIIILTAIILILNSCKKFDIATSLPIEQKVDIYFTFLSEKKGFNGVVLILKDGSVLIEKGYGSASDEKTIPMKAETILDIGSVTKTFTSAAIMKLVEQKTLNTEQKIADFFQNVPADKKDITIHQLLTHTSGLPADFAGDLEVLTKEQAFQKILNSKLVHQPGGKYEYSNTGYAVLAFIIEQVTNQSFHSFVRDSVLSKLEMYSTGFYGDNYLSPNLYYTGYMNNIKTDYASINSSYLYGNTLGNGGILSTTSDLIKWTNTVTSNFFTQSIRDKIFTPYTKNYGYGWELNITDYGRLYTHNGGGLGGNSYVAIYPDKNITIIILSNRITFRITKISLPADEAGKQIMINIMEDDFGKLPRKTWPPGRW